MASLRRSIVASVLFTVFGGPGILLVLLPWLCTRFHLPPDEPAWRIAIAIALVAAGLVPLLESIVRFVVRGRGALIPVVPTEHLVVSGLYRFVRNPMYLWVLAILSGEVLLFWNPGMFRELVVVAMAMHAFVCLYEEPRLTRTFGDEYRAYRSHVPRWIPRLSPWNPGQP